MDFLPDDSKLLQVRASLRKFQKVTSLKVDLPLAELEAAHEDMEVFMKNPLQELNLPKPDWRALSKTGQPQ